MKGSGKVICIDDIRELSSNDVYIGRATDKLGGLPESKWANPFSTGLKFEKVINFRNLLVAKIRSGEISKQELVELFGKNLICHCKTPPCHGYILLAEINKAHSELLLKQGKSL